VQPLAGLDSSALVAMPRLSPTLPQSPDAAHPACRHGRADMGATDPPSDKQPVRQKGCREMTIADITLAIFTLANSLRVFAYVPQIVKAVRDRSGAEAISFGTWALFLVSHASAMAYALVNKADWTMASVFLSNAVGCIAILLIAAWKRARHRSRRIARVA
jgi:uncharacterized protein with PQ loop repeat